MKDKDLSSLDEILTFDNLSDFDIENLINDKSTEDDLINKINKGELLENTNLDEPIVNEEKIIKEEDKHITREDIEKINKNLKNNQGVKKVVIAVSALTTIGLVGNFAKTKYDEYKLEQARLSTLDKEHLNLKVVIDTTDDYLNGKAQMNWKDVLSVVANFKNNYTENIDIESVEKVCALFLEGERIKSLDEVVSNLDIKEKEKDRIYIYRDELEYFGYTPEKLLPDSSQMKFINSIKSAAILNYNETKILPSITIAQAILESNWGESELTKESNNLFGIKADKSWNGDYVVFETKEFNSLYIKDKFRKYDTLLDSITDHSNFLVENKRYTEGGVFDAKTYKPQALALQESGYSTAEDENGEKIYASMLEQLIRQYNLQLIDWEVQNKYS
jgi:hypothetical protein